MSRVFASAQSCLTLWNFRDCSLLGSSVPGIFQTRILQWVAISYSRGSSWPRDRIRVSCVSCTGRQILYHFATWEVLENPLYMAILRVSRSGHVFPRVKQGEAALVFLCQQGRMLHNQDWLHNLWGPAQNENVESLVKKLRNLRMPQQNLKPSNGPHMTA